MTIREITEQNEKLILSESAKLSCETKGRKNPEELCELRTEFQRDRDRIIHSKSFRRLKHKTQVFLAPEDDHYRTRLTHTLEVAQIARTIARALRLNEDLTEAIALGHDLGHTPFGHAGERALNEIVPGGFRHFDQSARVCEYVERNFRGLNLTAEVLDGIKNHTRGVLPNTLEGQIVRIADKIAYMNHDIDDAVRGKVISEDDLDFDVKAYLGIGKSQRINTFVKNLIENSDKYLIKFDDECQKHFDNLHRWLYDNVYLNPVAKKEESKVFGIIEGLYNYYCEFPDRLPIEYRVDIDRDGKEVAIADYIAGMSDHYAITVYSDIFIPKGW